MPAVVVNCCCFVILFLVTRYQQAHNAYKQLLSPLFLLATPKKRKVSVCLRFINSKYSSSHKCTQERSAADPEPMTTQQKTLSTLSSSSSSSDSSSSEPSDQALRPPVTLGRSVSGSKRQSVFLGHGEEEIESSSQGLNPNDDQEDMKEVEIETEDPSHLFWVCIHRSWLFLRVYE